MKLIVLQFVVEWKILTTNKLLRCLLWFKLYKGWESTTGLGPCWFNSSNKDRDQKNDDKSMFILTNQDLIK